MAQSPPAGLLPQAKTLCDLLCNRTATPAGLLQLEPDKEERGGQHGDDPAGSSEVVVRQLVSTIAALKATLNTGTDNGSGSGGAALPRVTHGDQDVIWEMAAKLWVSVDGPA